MSFPFIVGDKVYVAVENVPYTFTQYKSEGIVTRVEVKLGKEDHSFCFIKFYKCTGDLDNEHTPHEYKFYLNEIDLYFKLLEERKPLSEADQKYEKVILKIRSMQSKRKGKGYAY